MNTSIFFAAFVACFALEVSGGLLDDRLLDRDFYRNKIRPVVLDIGANLVNQVRSFDRFDDGFRPAAIIDPSVTVIRSAHQIIQPVAPVARAVVGAVLRNGVKLQSPKIDANIDIRGPLGGRLRTGFKGDMIRAIGRGMVGAIERDFDVRSPITGAGFGRTAKGSVELKRGLFGRVKGSASGAYEGRVHDVLGRTIRGGVRGGISGGVVVDDPIVHRGIGVANAQLYY